MQLQKITVEWDDMTIDLVYDTKDKKWKRIVTGGSCFAVTTMTLEDMEKQLKAVMESLRERLP